MKSLGATLAALLALSALPLAAEANAGQSTEGDAPDRTAYDLHCALCHGEDGAPVEALERIVQVEMAHLGSERIQALSDEELEAVILEGAGKMKPVISIDASEIAEAIALLRTLKEE